MKLDVDYHPLDHQWQWHNNPSRFLVAVCGRQIGKTTAAVNELIKRALQNPGSRNWYVTTDYRQAKRNVWEQVKHFLPKELNPYFNNSELVAKVQVNGKTSTIELIGVENAEPLRGAVVHFMILDEYASFPRYVWQQVLRPMLSTTAGDVWFIGTPKGYNHFWELFETKHADFTHYLVPACKVDRTQKSVLHPNGVVTETTSPYAKVEELQSALDTSLWENFAQEYLAEFTKKSGAIWPMFDRNIHVEQRRNPSRDSAIFGSIDFGFALSHPTAVLWHEVTSTGEVHTFDGIMIQQKNLSEISELMRIQTQGMVVRGIYPDPARPDLIEELRKLGWNTLDVNKDVELGIAKVAEFMNINPATNKPRWTIADHLSDGIKQVEGYEWQSVRLDDGRYLQIPKKQDDDVPDALRYFLYNFNQPTKELDTRLRNVVNRALMGEFQ